MTNEDFGAIAREIVDSNSYMAIGTADESGAPWVSPVWFAPEDYRAFFSPHRPNSH